mgnify:CR=1 FL=1
MSIRRRIRTTNRPLVQVGGTTVVSASTLVPTVIISERLGQIDNIVDTFNIRDENLGLRELLGPFTTGPTDNVGYMDSIFDLSGSFTYHDFFGPKDSLLLQATEFAQTASATPDSDSWGDAWVDRTVLNAGTHQPNGATLNCSALTPLTQNDAYCEANFNRFVSFTSTATSSTFTFTANWPSVVLAPNATLQVDFLTQAGRPFVESTVTANTRARFSSGAPFSQRTFTFPQDGATRVHSVTFSASETDNILSAKWLLVQWTVPDLTVGAFTIQARRANNTTVENYNFFMTKP